MAATIDIKMITNKRGYKRVTVYVGYICIKQIDDRHTGLMMVQFICTYTHTAALLYAALFRTEDKNTNKYTIVTHKLYIYKVI